jgi:phenylacetate-CoA ligase
VLIDAERAAFTDAVRLRAHRWFDVDMGAREVVLWGSPIELGRQDRLRELRDRLLNSRLLSAFDLGEEALARYAQVLRRFKPLKLYGYASVLDRLARYLERTGWEAGPGWPRAVFATAEPLDETQRATIGRVLGCPVAVEYGARDAGLMANECPAGGLHVAAEGMIVEVLPAPGLEPGLGEIVVTNLRSFAMPLIRYRTGDLGEWDPEPCPCGRHLPRLRRVVGRRTDFLVTPRGRVLHALSAIYVLRDIPEVREFQLVQEALDRVVVEVVPETGFGERPRRRIIEGLDRLFDGAADVEVRCVSSIARAPSGKHRYVVSKVTEPLELAAAERRG